MIKKTIKTNANETGVDDDTDVNDNYDSIDDSDFTVDANAEYLCDGATVANTNHRDVTDVNVDADTADDDKSNTNGMDYSDDGGDVKYQYCP